MKLTQELMRRMLLIVSVMLLYCHLAFSNAESTDDFTSALSLDEILNLPVTVASKKALSMRESPGVVTVITEADIRGMGARDLIDVLQMVSGIAIAEDVVGVLGIGFRGNWAYEGKILLLIDDHEMNELNFSTFELGNHYPIDQIKKIEIIRGPGSAIYGGYAELAVIKITTKAAEEINGAIGSTKVGAMPHSLGRLDFNLETGKKLNEDLSYKVGALIGRGNRSDRDYTDLYGNQFNMAGNSNLNPLFINADLKYKKFDLSVIYDHYVTTDRTAYGIVLPKAVSVNFDSLLSTAKYNWGLLDNKLEITPAIRFDYFQPWNSVGTDATQVVSITDSTGAPLYPLTLYNRRTERLRFEVVGAYDVNESLNLLLGTEKNFYYGRDDLGIFLSTGTNQFNYSTAAIYSQGLWNTGWFRVTLGARYEMNSLVGNAFVPRAVLTKNFDRLHFKLLASSSFRAPGIENIDSNPRIQPERTTVYEVESGYQLSKDFLFTVNLFDITIKNPIIYTGSSNSYVNYNQSGSRGIELEAKHIVKDHRNTLAYSFYSASGKTDTSAYIVSGNDDALLGLPQHKWTLNSSHRIWNDLYFNPTVIYLGSRYGYIYSGQPSLVEVTTSSPQSAVLTQFSGTWLVNAYWSYKDFLVKELSVGVGVFNVLNQIYDYPQPYFKTNSGNAPLPAPLREWVADIAYHYGF